MSDKPYHINRVITAFAIAVVVYLLYLWVLYRYMNRIWPFPAGREITFNKWVLLYPALVVVDMLIYNWLRTKHIVRRYATIHTWSVMTHMIILPVLSLLLIIIVSQQYGLEELLTASWISGLLGLAGLLLFIVGHLFLLMLISKRNDHIMQEKDPTDYLHEFEQP